MSTIKGLFKTLKLENDDLGGGDALLDAFGRGVQTAKDVLADCSLTNFHIVDLDDMEGNEADMALTSFKQACIGKYKANRGPKAAPYLAGRLNIEENQIGEWLKKSAYDAFICGVRAVWLKAVITD